MIIIEQWTPVETIQKSTRFHQYKAQHVTNHTPCMVYAFQTTETQNKDIVWNDFQIAIHAVQKVLSTQFVDAQVLDDVYYFVVQLKAEQTMRSWLQEPVSIERRFHIWLKIAQQMATYHAQGITHGSLHRDNIYLTKAEPRTICITDILLWRFYQIFELGLLQQAQLPVQIRSRNYRYERDDYYCLGLLLCDCLYPDLDYPTNELELQLLPNNSDELYKILYYLLFQRDDVTLSTIFEVAQQYMERYIKQATLYLQWDRHLSQFFFVSETELIDWEQMLFQDVSEECYVFTTYQRESKRTMLHAIGKMYEWQLVIVDSKDDIFGDAVPHSVKELTYVERERLKEKGKRYHGQWQFKAICKSENVIVIQQIRSHSIERAAKKREKLQSRQILDEWNRVLTLQQSLLTEHQDILTYHRYTVEPTGRIVFYIEDNKTLMIATGAELATTILEAEVIIGTVLEQGTDYITVLLHKDFDYSMLAESGELYEYMKRKAILLRRQQKVLADFIHGKSASPQIRAAIIKPEEIKQQQAPLMETFQTLNDDQTRSLQLALKADPLFLLQGPPGTGKTTWVTELILQIYLHNPYARILIASQSNVAIDHAFEKTLSILQQHETKFKRMPTAVRIGLEDKTSDFSKDWMLDQVVHQWSESLIENAYDNIAMIAQQQMLEDPARYMRLMTIFDDWKTTLQRSNEIKPVYLQQKPILVGATCMGSYAFHNWKQQFDWVIIDEAAKATVPETIIPMTLGEKVVLVGDHKQLSPIVQLEERETQNYDKALQQQLERSLFEELFDDIVEAKGTLQTQYRMHPTIAHIVSALFYEQSPLITGKKQLLAIAGQAPLNWLATDGHSKEAEQTYKTSYYNMAEIEVIQHHLIYLNELTTVTTTVAIITGYAAQREKLRDAIQSMALNHLQIEIDTVDAFQGKETDVVYYSLVRQNEALQFGFLGDERRTNVMLSRAKEHLYIVGHYKQIQRLPAKHVLHRLVKALRAVQSFELISWEEVIT